MTTAAEILSAHRIAIRSTNEGRYYTTCPQCSQKRKASHRRLKCLGVTIGRDGVMWGCNHCGWTGGGRFYENAGSNRHRHFRVSQHQRANGRSLLTVKLASPARAGRRPPWSASIGSHRRLEDAMKRALFESHRSARRAGPGCLAHAERRQAQCGRGGQVQGNGRAAECLRPHDGRIFVLEPRA
jgi:hypothetical protein